jgi:general secretion pathway protein B
MDTNKQNIAIEALQPGMVITQITAQNGPVKIRKSGLVTSQDMVKGLAEMGVLEVEIDPAQTVALETDTTGSTLSKTQQLLADDRRLDQGISDQFNRSLFLPSIQHLPSLWQYYGRITLVWFVLIIGGFATGFTISLLQTQWQKITITVETDTPELGQPEHPIDKSEEATTEDLGIATSTEYSMEDENADKPVSDTQDEQIAVAPESEQSDPQTEQPRVLGYIPEQSVNDIEPEPRQVQVADDAFTIDSPEPATSSSLMRKFEQAIADMEDESQLLADESAQSQTPQGIPRIDQLPPWMLTELPSMAFSAHMYASLPADRWLRVNGEQKREGDWIDDKVQIKRIDPQHLIMRYKGEDFVMHALTDW